MMEQHLAPDRIAPLPPTLRSPQSKLVYLYLEATGGATVDDLNETLSMKKITILSILSSLGREELVEKSGDRYVALS
ncbi:helix-turn-helix domain-containing protein [Natronobiforma cellulositropha]|uniref:helix-turn-helix domain-containing protein n=1 Tax=Natronobiforma cellulositropha TaxID=1679076 RepID=UPI0021D5C413|nr:helix-turn-helix domain-containing protein [Natronobiforma cellulositropha]